jgi:hypothetical protein
MGVFGRGAAMVTQLHGCAGDMLRRVETLARSLARRCQGGEVAQVWLRALQLTQVAFDR